MCISSYNTDFLRLLLPWDDIWYLHECIRLPFWYPMLMSLTIFGGSLEFLAVSMLLAPFAPVQTFIMALMIQARHLFYGIAMLDKFKGMGWKNLT